MDAVLRATAVYLFLFVVFRISGRRTLADITTFDFVLLLIVAETTQQALLGEDFSVTNSMLLITTLIVLDIALSLAQSRWRRIGRVLEGEPLALLENGVLQRERMQRARVDVGDILEAAREKQGLSRLDQIEHAVLERGGGISIVPCRNASARAGDGS